MHKITKLFVLIIIITFPAVFAFGAVNINDNPSYTPHVYLGGYTGSEALGQADVLAPVFLKNNINLFVYGQGRYSYAKEDWAKDPWTGSLGLGYRQLVANTAVLGAYVLGDYTQTTTDHDIWLISPGIEALGRVWDFRANGYFPVSNHDWKIEGWADEFGDYSHIYFHGHNQYNAWYIYHEETGPGTDAELGRKLFNCHNILVKGFVNGYYFNMKHNEDVYGGGGRVTIQPNTYLEFSLNDTYDNYAHNTFMFGLEVSLYDLFQKGDKTLDNNDLQRRLFERIDRNFAETGSGSDARITGGPEDDQSPEIGHNYLEYDNVWFFKGNTTTATSAHSKLAVKGTTVGEEDGTFEDPYKPTDFNQQTLNDIGENAYIFFSGGTWNAFTAGSSYTPITLSQGQILWGRMGADKGYQEPATGGNRPIFIGAFKLNNDTGLNSLILRNNRSLTGFDLGIDVVGDGVLMDNIIVGNNNDNESYKTVIEIDNAANEGVTITNSTVFGYNDTKDNYGIKIDDSKVNISNSFIFATNNSISTLTSAVGIVVETTNKDSTLNIDNSYVGAINDTGLNATGIAANFLVITTHRAIVNIRNDNIGAFAILAATAVYVAYTDLNILGHQNIFIAHASGGVGVPGLATGIAYKKNTVVLSEILAGNTFDLSGTDEEKTREVTI